MTGPKLPESKEPKPERQRIIEDLENQRHSRRIEALKDRFRTAMGGIDRAKAANDDVYRRRLEIMGQMSANPSLNLKPATFAGTKGQKFIKNTKKA